MGGARLLLVAGCVPWTGEMKRPFFSCVVPVKGARPFMDAALASLSAQGMDDDLEVIVQDGDVEPDAGQSDALNKGFAKAKGDWLFWLNADDILMPGALLRVKDLVARRPGLKWVAGDQAFIDRDGRIEAVRYGTKWLDWAFRRICPHVNGPSSFFRRDLLEQVGGFDVELHNCMDWDLWIKFAKAGERWVRIPELLWAWRRHDGSKTSSAIRASEQIAAIWAEIDAMLKKNGSPPSRFHSMLYRAYRICDGSLVKSWWMSKKLRGRYL